MGYPSADAGTFEEAQIHNLSDWETHLKTLVEWKAQGGVRYIGVTTSHGRRHETLEQVMAEQPIDLRAVHLQHPRPRGRAASSPRRHASTTCAKTFAPPTACCPTPPCARG